MPKSRKLLAGLLGLALGCVSAAGADSWAGLGGAVKIDGSSTFFPISEAVSEEFSKAAPRVRVTVGQSGTGGGFKRFCAGETDICNASRPIRRAERDRAEESGIEFVELPLAFDGISIVVNRRNTWAVDLTLDELKRVFLEGSAVRSWRDIRPSWPDQPLKLYAPGTDSGTFDYFKEVIAGDGGALRSDLSVSEDDNVLVRGVSGDEGALGFFGCAYYFANRARLRAVPIDGGGGPVAPTHGTIEQGAYAPFSRPLFIYVSARALARPQVMALAEFSLDKGPELAEEVGYVRLPDAIYARARANLAARRLGTQFLDAAGGRVHGSLAEVYR